MPMAPISLISLPLEVLDEIVVETMTSDQLSLCMTSKLLGAVSTRTLYRDLVLHSPKRMIGCCRTLSTNSSVALAARSLIIKMPLSTKDNFFRSYYTLVGNALKLTTRLTSFGVLFFDIPHGDILDGCVLPHLRNFTFSAESTEHAISFLHRHPHIEALHFLSPYEVFDTYEFSSLSFPTLKLFSGPATTIPHLLRDCPVEHAHIVWESGYNDWEGVMSSFRPLIVLDNTTLGWSLELAQVVLKHSPSLKYLSFRNGFPVERPYFSTNDFVLALDDIIPQFKDLMHLSLSRLVSLDGPTKMWDLDKEFDTVIRWGQSCPSLRLCTLPSGIVWCRIRDTAWFPQEGHWLRDRWLVKMLGSGKYPVMMRVLLTEMENNPVAVEALTTICSGSGSISLTMDDTEYGYTSEEDNDSTAGNADTGTEDNAD